MRVTKKRNIITGVITFVLILGIYVAVGLMPRGFKTDVTPNFVTFCEDNLQNFKDTAWLETHGALKQTDGVYKCDTLRVEPYTTSLLYFSPEAIPDSVDVAELVSRMTFTAEGKKIRTPLSQVLFWPFRDISIHVRIFTCYIDAVECARIELCVTSDADYATLENEFYDMLRTCEVWPVYYDYEGYEGVFGIGEG